MSDNKEKKPQTPWAKNLAIWAVIVLGLIVAVSMFSGGGARSDQSVIAYSDFLQKVEDGAVEQVEIQGQELSGAMASNSSPMPRTTPVLSRAWNRRV